MKVIFFVLLTILFSLLFLALGSFKSRDQPVIKGFYTGMDFETAKSNCIKIFQEVGISLKPFEEITRKRIGLRFLQ